MKPARPLPEAANANESSQVRRSRLADAIREAAAKIGHDFDALDRGRHFILGDDGDPQPCDMAEWAAAFENREAWAIGQTQTATGLVSTVFLGLNHNFGGGPPVLFETAIFPKVGNIEVLARYHTRADALAGHAAYVAWREGQAPNPDADDEPPHPP
jgi:hypothetical protein